MTLLIRRSKFVWQYFAIAATALVIFGGVISLVTGDYHYLPRFGAFVVAIGAVLVVLQIQFDIEIEREFQAVLRKIDDDDPEVKSQAMENVAERFKQQSRTKAHEEVRESRTSAAVIVAAITAGGELVHGWGDVWMSYLDRLLF